MTERAGVPMRRTGMKRTLLPLVLLAVVLAGCGDDKDADTTAEPQDVETSAEVELCETGPATAPARELGAVDVDGDGKKDPIRLEAGTAPGDDCPAGPLLVIAAGSGMDRGPVPVPFDESLPVTAADVRGVVIPGHQGDLVLVVQKHPRGGFAAHLSSLREGRMRGVLSEDGELAPFVATDAPTAYLSARCTADGFEVFRAIAQDPVGVVPAWNVEKTTVPGDSLTDGTTEKVADNLRQGQFEERFPDLVRNSLFENC